MDHWQARMDQELLVMIAVDWTRLECSPAMLSNRSKHANTEIISLHLTGATGELAGARVRANAGTGQSSILACVTFHR